MCCFFFFVVGRIEYAHWCKSILWVQRQCRIGVCIRTTSSCSTNEPSIHAWSCGVFWLLTSQQYVRWIESAWCATANAGEQRCQKTGSFIQANFLLQTTCYEFGHDLFALLSIDFCFSWTCAGITDDSMDTKLECSGKLTTTGHSRFHRCTNTRKAKLSNFTISRKQAAGLFLFFWNLKCVFKTK